MTMRDRILALKDKFSGDRTVYEGDRLRSSHQVRVRAEPGGVVLRQLSPNLSQELYNHSPCGFNWGYPGSGPAQLALAILLDATGGDEEVSLRYYHSFKWEIIAKWGDEWAISREDIINFIDRLNASKSEFTFTF